MTSGKFLVIPAVLVTALIGIAAWAVTQKDIDQQQKTIDQLNNQVTAAKMEVSTLTSEVNQATTDPMASGACSSSCVSSNECKSVVSILKLAPKAFVIASHKQLTCVTLYDMENNPKSPNIVSLNGGAKCLQGPVAKCPIVQKKEKVKNAKGHLGDLQSQLKDAQAKLDKLNDDYANSPAASEAKDKPVTGGMIGGVGGPNQYPGGGIGGVGGPVQDPGAPPAK